jgi:hypothetical protein
VIGDGLFRLYVVGEGAAVFICGFWAVSLSAPFPPCVSRDVFIGSLLFCSSGPFIRLSIERKARPIWWRADHGRLSQQSPFSVKLAVFI